MTAFNRLAEKRPSTVVSESLSHTFDYHRGSNWNRRLSSWVRGKLNERLSFKALAKGFSHQQVNPAYSSQTCIPCGYVDRKNRRGDLFQCQYCRHVGDADSIAALNHKSRYFDREITRYTPYREVKRILLERFHRHLETKSSGTVSGRIPDTAQHESTMCGQSESEFKNVDQADVYV
jgi:IS605 OrfB family transposase